MNRYMKYVIGAIVLINVFSLVSPAKNYTFGNIEAYGATYNAASEGEISSLSVIRGEDDEVDLLDSYNGDEISLSSQSDYYLELKGAEGINLKAEVVGEGYVVKVFTSGDKTEKGKDIEEFIKIDSTYANIYLRTYRSEEEYREAYDEEDVTDCEKTYMIHVKKPEVNSDEELEAEHAYLNNIYLSNGKVNFSKTKNTYNVNVPENAQEVLVRATPEEEEFLVYINDTSVTQENNFEKNIRLVKGYNTVTIYVEGNDDDNTYTINIFRGDKKTDSIVSEDDNISGKDINGLSQTGNLNRKTNAWRNKNGKIQYTDGTGEVLKNQWWFDKSTGISYHLKEDGDRARGWLQDKTNWYYFNENGEMKTGWVYADNKWYYLSKSGVMKTGWIKDTDGSWYYLDFDGHLTTNS